MKTLTNQNLTDFYNQYHSDKLPSVITVLTDGMDYESKSYEEKHLVIASILNKIENNSPIDSFTSEEKWDILEICSILNIRKKVS